MTAARAAEPWLATGSVIVQQQALKDFALAMANFFAGTHRRPTWRRAGKDEGFRIVAMKPGNVRRISRNVGQVRIPKVGWVRFRWSRAVPRAKSYRVTRDRAGRRHVAFAVAPPPLAGPGTGSVVGVDRGVVVSAALSTGELLRVPGLRETEARRLRLLRRRLARARPGSRRRAGTKAALARLHARAADRRKDWVEKTSTALATRFDVIAVEDLKIANMTRSARGTRSAPGRGVTAKAALNRGILASGWGQLVRRLDQKAPGRVVKVKAAYTSQRCSACGNLDRKARESQAVFRCGPCGFVGNADVNAALNVGNAARHAVAAREGLWDAGPTHREPHLAHLRSFA
ncbi:RNA-guided endonuclease InsQ/TnpB family protein [Actinomadura namibiensis]|nr:transposase [Actinomadura namibiensis]